MALADVTDDFVPRLGRELDEAEEALVEVRLDDVERMIRARIPDLNAKITAGKIDENNVIYIECEAVLRLLRNPDGFATESDGNYSYSFNYNVASGSLFITDDEWSLLGIGKGMFVIRPYAPYPVAYDQVNPLWEYFPFFPDGLDESS